MKALLGSTGCCSRLIANWNAVLKAMGTPACKSATTGQAILGLSTGHNDALLALMANSQSSTYCFADCTVEIANAHRRGASSAGTNLGISRKRHIMREPEFALRSDQVSISFICYQCAAQMFCADVRAHLATVPQAPGDQKLGSQQFRTL